jgi:muramoyltetrapeptide carboxypeptidase LdcA involved in peptidoglycan recycling
MRYPEFLGEKGTIGFVAPSFGCNIEPYRSGFENAQKIFKELGHEIVLGPNCYEGSGIGISNTPEACGEELTTYYCSDKCDVLISCGGGELMCETMEHVDFEQIANAQPKWYMGYSDNTNMTFLLATLADTASVYGPCAAQFGMEPWHQSLQDAYDILRGRKLTVNGYKKWERDSKKDEEHPLVPYNLTEKKILKCYIPKGGQLFAAPKDKTLEINGRLIGGCLDCLVTILGTKFDGVTDFNEKYKADGFIWFIESCDLNVMGIRRAIWQMKNAGWFGYVRGFMIGRPYVFGQEMMGLDQYHAVTDLLAEYGVPVIMDADIGHLSPMMPLVTGSVATIKVHGNDISVSMQLK